LEFSLKLGVQSHTRGSAEAFKFEFETSTLSSGLQGSIPPEAITPAASEMQLTELNHKPSVRVQALPGCTSYARGVKIPACVIVRLCNCAETANALSA
jgi:hypothetical protein